MRVNVRVRLRMRVRVGLVLSGRRSLGRIRVRDRRTDAKAERQTKDEKSPNDQWVIQNDSLSARDDRDFIKTGAYRACRRFGGLHRLHPLTICLTRRIAC